MLWWGGFGTCRQDRSGLLSGRAAARVAARRRHRRGARGRGGRRRGAYGNDSGILRTTAGPGNYWVYLPDQIGGVNAPNKPSTASVAYLGGMSTRLSRLTAGQLPAAVEIAMEFLGQSGTDDLRADFAAHPELTIALTIDGAVQGVAFGHPVQDGGASLQGITVDDAHTARGLGSLLLASFERAAADAGCRTVSLGSGPGYVEHFYLKNGYSQPVAALINIDDLADLEDRAALAAHLADLRYPVRGQVDLPPDRGDRAVNARRMAVKTGE
jgi:GNAT superfamily N-acetyltransferase